MKFIRYNEIYRHMIDSNGNGEKKTFCTHTQLERQLWRLYDGRKMLFQEMRKQTTCFSMSFIREMEKSIMYLSMC